MKPTCKCTAIGAADLGLTWQSPKESSARGRRPDGALMLAVRRTLCVKHQCGQPPKPLKSLRPRTC
jgi:hypothetical protein